MRTIVQIYDDYGIPSALQMHMLRVAGIADQILSKWYGPFVNRNSLIRVLLLHDMGNIVKIKEEDLETIQAKHIRQELIEKIGPDDHKVSLEIGKKLRLSMTELELMDGKVFIKNDETIRSDDYGRKIGAYSDQRAAPGGVNPILDRLREAQVRYRNKPGSSMNNPKTAYLIQCAIQLEKQIMAFCHLKPNEITDESIASFVENLRGFSL